MSSARHPPTSKEVRPIPWCQRGRGTFGEVLLSRIATREPRGYIMPMVPFQQPLTSPRESVICFGRSSCPFLLATGAVIGLALHAVATTAPPAIDGDFREWSDFGDRSVRLFATADRVCLYIRTESAAVLQADSGVSVYIDADGNPATGLSRPPVGAEFRWDAGVRRGVAFTAEGDFARSIRYTDLEWISAPVMDSSEFEISMRRQDAVATSCTVMVERNSVILGVASAPYGSKTFERNVSPARSVHADFRLMTYNVLNDDLLDDPDKKDRFLAEFAELQPDVICFTEVYYHSAEDVRIRVAEALPYMTEASGDGSWDSRIVSRYPIVFAQSLGRFGRSHAARVRSADGSVDQMVITAHFSCCSASDSRRTEMSDISTFIARLRSGEFPGVPLDLPVILAGDLNLVRHDAANFANFQNVTALRPLRAIHLDRNEDYTWRNDSGTFGYSPGRLDYILSGEGLVALHAFVYESENPPSDHLPVIADFAIDADRNGLADKWERAYFGTIGRDGSSDEDADSWRNDAEQRLGTNPLDSSSRPQLRASPADGGPVLQFSGHGNGNVGFRLMYSHDLRTWVAAGLWTPGDEKLPFGGSGRSFYRAVLED
jgi:endonuclease/exonuclease/phosphatase (EEP) superfamily protein YafD